MSEDKGKPIGYALDENTVKLTGDGLSNLFEHIIETQGREAFEEMMRKSGFHKVMPKAWLGENWSKVMVQVTADSLYRTIDRLHGEKKELEDKLEALTERVEAWDKYESRLEKTLLEVETFSVDAGKWRKFEPLLHDILDWAESGVSWSISEGTRPAKEYKPDSKNIALVREALGVRDVKGITPAQQFLGDTQ